MDLTSRPSWVADAVFYQVFPDRFAMSERVPKPSNLEPWSAPPTRYGYKGGDLYGVIEHLDWLSDLGINAIYLNPIFQSASNHRYHTHDYYLVDPLLGGDQAFETLLGACRERGIRVVLDGVFNHAGRGFFRFNDILENGAASPWCDWFIVSEFPLNAYRLDEPPNYDAWWNAHALPKLNTHNPAVREYLMKVAEHWIRRGASGWRLDVPEEIETKGFWEEMRERVRSIDPEAYLVGEVWGSADDWVSSGTRFDGVMNYPMTEAHLRFAAGGRIDAGVVDPVNLTLDPPLDAAGYAAAVAEHLDRYPWEAHLANLNILGSHDTARVLSMVGGDSRSVALAAVLQFTFPGAPCVYYGDEIGVPGEHDPGCRAGFPWDRPESWDRDLLDTFRELITLRHSEPALRHGRYRTLVAEGDLYVFVRETEDERLLVALNADDRPATTGLSEQPATLLWGAGELAAGGLSMAGRSAGVWRAVR
jgi:glycosidase